MKYLNPCVRTKSRWLCFFSTRDKRKGKNFAFVQSTSKFGSPWQHPNRSKIISKPPAKSPGGVGSDNLLAGLMSTNKKQLKTSRINTRSDWLVLDFFVSFCVKTKRKVQLSRKSHRTHSNCCYCLRSGQQLILEQSLFSIGLSGMITLHLIPVHGDTNDTLVRK